MTVNGVDVSAYQTPSEWRSLSPAFVFVKASEGEHTHDKGFGPHIAMAQSVGALGGAYHFGWPIQDVAKEVENFAQAVSASVVTGRVRMLVLDLEPYSDRRNTKGLTSAQIRSWAAQWVRLVKARFPACKVGLYFDMSVLGAQWVPNTADFYWVAQYPGGLTYSTAAKHGMPKLGPGYPAALFWQFTSSPLDMSIGAFPSIAALREWAGSKTTPIPAPLGSYTVKGGDTMSGIAAAHHIDLALLEKANPQIPNFDRIYAGQIIHLPPQALPPSPVLERYTVRSGDTMSSIATAHHVTLAALERQNPQIRDPDLIMIGQVLTIPART